MTSASDNPTHPCSADLQPAAERLAQHSVGVDEAVSLLTRGELVALPTETVYGLAGLASNPQAVGKIFSLKGRPTDRPLIVHIASFKDLNAWARDIPEYAYALAKAFWPGPMALVLPKASGVLDSVTGGQDSVALRVPDHPLTLAVLERLGAGVAAPSANRYGSISPTEAMAVALEFGDQCPAILDGGPCSVGVESTIVSCLGDRPKILRPGAVGAEEIALVTGLAVDGAMGSGLGGSGLVGGELGIQASEVDESAVNEIEAGLSAGVGDGVDPPQVVVPGQVLSHYAPKTPCVLLRRGEMADWVARWKAQRRGEGECLADGAEGFLGEDAGQGVSERRGKGGVRVGFLGYSAAPFEADESVLWPLEASQVAKVLYRDLRSMDQLGLDVLVVEAVLENRSGSLGLWAAIEDRLARACNHGLG